MFFNSHKSWGGGEKWHYEATLFFKERGYTVIAFADHRSLLYKKLQGQIPVFGVRFSNLSYLNPINILLIARILLKYDVTTIVLCLPIDLKIGGFAAKIAGIRNIIYRRGSAIPIKNSFSNRFIFRFIINNIIANSVATKATILQNNKNLFCPDKIKVLYNGIEIINYYNKRIQNEIVIGTAGRLEKQKNHEALIRIAKILEDNEINYSIKIAGEGSCKQLLESEIKRSGMSDKVELCGFKQDIHEFLNELDVFVLPSKWEGFGYVLAEAMMHRLPIVTFDISSNPELVINNDNGFLVQPFDEQAFADKLVILSTNHKLREKMGQRGYERVITKFDKEENLKLTETYLLSL